MLWITSVNYLKAFRYQVSLLAVGNCCVHLDDYLAVKLIFEYFGPDPSPDIVRDKSVDIDGTIDRRTVRRTLPLGRVGTNLSDKS